MAIAREGRRRERKHEDFWPKATGASFPFSGHLSPVWRTVDISTVDSKKTSRGNYKIWHLANYGISWPWLALYLNFCKDDCSQNVRINHYSWSSKVQYVFRVALFNMLRSFVCLNVPTYSLLHHFTLVSLNAGAILNEPLITGESYLGWETQCTDELRAFLKYLWKTHALMSSCPMWCSGTFTCLQQISFWHGNGVNKEQKQVHSPLSITSYKDRWT